MKLLVDRAWKKDTYTISRFFVDGKRFYESLEDKDRGLKQTDSLEHILKIKVPGETAIPSGIYKITLDVVSAKYKAVKWYNDLCGGRMPRLLNVPGYDGILIHPLTSALDSRGCIGVGRNTIKGKLTSSRDTFKSLYQKMKVAWDRGEEITIEIR
jgi:hypothetical protein